MYIIYRINWFLRKIEKVCIVFDAVSKLANERSLSDNLHIGPCYLPNLHNLLIRFCIGKIVLVSGIQQAFLQILFHERIESLYDFSRLRTFLIQTQLFKFYFWWYFTRSNGITTQQTKSFKNQTVYFVIQ